MSDRQLIADLLSALEYHTEQTRPIEFSKVAIEAAREYLRKPEQPAQQEPGRNHWEDGDVFERIAASKPRPQAREPLTDEQVAYILGQLPKPPTNDGSALHDWAMQAVRALAAHFKGDT